MHTNSTENNINFSIISSFGRVMDSHTDDNFYTPQEVAEKLKIKLSSVQKYARQGKLPFYVFGKHYRFKKSDVDAFIDQSKGVPSAVKLDEIDENED